ncbi:MAG: phosphoribosylamine--glycine ligase, partial [Candidatus Colwellbacteria bacterium CG23_combo_of_CG06-09_8_20_14_all_42_19]
MDKIDELISRKFLFVSLESLSGDLAWSLVKEGHEVKSYIKSKTDIDVYTGFIERVDAWEPYIDWADVIIFDDIEFGAQADRLRKKGKKVVGGSAYTDRLEIDREFGQAELRKYGVNTLPGQNFSNYDEAINFIKVNPGRYVFKPSGNTPSGGKGLLFIGQEEDGKDLIELLEQNKNVWQKKAPLFILQKFISGVEVAVGAFFNGHDFIYPINVNFEHKRVFPGDIGPFSGEMGTLMYWSPTNNLFRSTLLKMLPALRESGYVGYVDVNCIVNGKGIYPLEWTCRFGYPTIQIQQEGITMPAGEWLYKMAS